VKRIFVAVTKLPEAWSTSSLMSAPSSPFEDRRAAADSILAAGLALQQAGVIAANVDVKGGGGTG